MDKVSYVGNADVSAIDHLYQQYRQDPTSVDIGWAKFFEGFEFAQTNYEQGGIPENFVKEFKVINLINGYRTRGHANIHLPWILRILDLQNKTSMKYFRQVSKSVSEQQNFPISLLI
jgi:2-oxoglutarate dehydrogenase complex dehydrogenase (E1) component-like enzyme